MNLKDLLLQPVTENDEPEVFDFKTGESAIFEVIGPGMDRTYNRGFWREHLIDQAMILNNGAGTMGALAYDASYGAGLEYTIESLVTEEEVPGPGFYVIEDVTCAFSKDYWGETDVDFYYDGVRPATQAEIDEYFGVETDLEKGENSDEG